MSKSKASASCLFPIMGDEGLVSDDDENQNISTEETGPNEEIDKPKKRKHSHHHRSHHEKQHKKSHKSHEDDLTCIEKFILLK